MHAKSALLLAVALVGTSWAAAAPHPALQVIPFAPKSGDGKTMTFTALPASATGLTVQNPYDDPAMWGDRYTEFQTGEIGTGLAVGDLNDDGLPDIYVVNKTRPNQLFLQVAPFRFADASATAGAPGGPTWKTGVTLADVNNDGALDLYVCQFDGPNLLYLNDGHGRFTEAGHAAGLDLVSGSVVGAFADYDRDGRLDLFVVTNVRDARLHPEGEVSHLYHNRGDGTFEEVTARAGLSSGRAQGHSATWFDYNDDGWPDLYVANDFAAPDHFYRNNGDSTFTDVLAEAVPHTPWFAMGADFGDIDNDGRLDLFVGDMAGTTHFKSKVTMGNMGGLVNDMDRLTTPQYMTNAVFLNSGADRFLEIARLAGLASSDWTWSPRFEDLDNDGWVDLHITNGMVRSFTDSDLLNRLKQAGSRAEEIALMRQSPVLREANLTLRNDHDLHFTKVQAAWELDHTGVSFGSAFADFDQDGDLDLVYVNFDDTVSLYRNDTPAGNSIELELRGTASNSHGVGARATAQTDQGRQVRELSVARGSLSSSQPILHFGLGASQEVPALTIRWPSGRVQHFEHLAANARYVITEPADPATLPPAVAHREVSEGFFKDEAKERGIEFVNRERVFDDTVRQSLLPNRMNTLGGGVAWADVNGDGHPDLFFAGAASHHSALYLGDRHGHFAPSPQPQPWDAVSEVEAMAPVFLDVNGDGHPDLFITSGSTESDQGSANLRARLYLNDGQGVFTAAAPEMFNPPPVSAAVAVAADFDRDGQLDLFVGGRVVPGAYPTAPRSMLLARRDGVLTDVTDQVCPALRQPGMVTAALWTDTDEDGWPDLLLVGEWMTPRLFHNDAGRTFTETTAAAGLDRLDGWWNSLAAADVNRDGHLDYVLGNFGLNTKYHASDDHPTALYYADIEGTGVPQIIEAEYEGSHLYPVRGRSCSSRAMPSVAEKFRTFNAFGRALLPEIYAPEKLETSLKLEARQLASGLLLNDGHGRFTFRALPRIAQAAPVFGLAALDCDGDGHLDLVGVQNFSGPQVETGRFDGGIGFLLLGDGRGGFTPAPAAQSGLLLPGDSRGLATGDVNQDGWPDLVVTRTNRPAALLVHRGAPAGRSFAVKLRGPAGNPDAIGAQLRVRFKDGSSQAAECAAGSGYLSQSAPLAFFGHAPDAAPVAIDVTWPDGRRTTHPYSAGQAILELHD